VYSLIKILLLLVLLPFKILAELAKHSSRRGHYQRRRTRATRPMRPGAAAPVVARPVGRAHWQSLPRGRQVLLLWLAAFAALVFAGATASLAASSGPSPAHHARSTAAASVPAAVPVASPTASAATPAPSPTPSPHAKRHHRRHHHHVTAPPAPAPTTSAPPAPAGCHPTTSSGHCYEPGEFCPHADAGMTGVAGDGKQITCEDNDGLRWEPV
jgi:hypothetical protein